MIDVTMKVRNVSAVVANFHAADAKLQRVVKDEVKKGAREIKRMVQQNCAYDTGFMHDHVKIFESAAGFLLSVGWDPSDFLGAGKPFYPVFVELGTKNMDAQPSLYPAYFIVSPVFEQNVSRAVSQAIERMHV